MCFSASASFLSSAFLVSSGIYCISRVIKEHNFSYLPLAAIPILFGVQQGWEGLLWLALRDKNNLEITLYALVFLFFSHFLWLFWMTFTALMLENRLIMKKVLMILVVIGFFYGIFLYFPLLVYPNWLSINIVNHSIQYQIRVLSTGIISPYLGIFLYVLVSLTGLFLSTNKSLNYLGMMLLTAFVLTEWLFDYAFISVWCFFAALISFYLLITLQHLRESTTIN